MRWTATAGSFRSRIRMSRPIPTIRFFMQTRIIRWKSGANIPGNIIRVLVKEGDEVEEKQPIAVIEAMKMETNILATAKGTVEKIYISEGQQVKGGRNGSSNKI